MPTLLKAALSDENGTDTDADALTCCAPTPGTTYCATPLSWAGPSAGRGGVRHLERDVRRRARAHDRERDGGRGHGPAERGLQRHAESLPRDVGVAVAEGRGHGA